MSGKTHKPQIVADIRRPSTAELNPADYAGRLSVSVVVYYADVAELSRCLECFKTPVVSDIVIWDNSSIPDTRTYLRKHYPNVKYIASENIGYGPGHNRAYAAVDGNAPYHLVVNSDIEFDPAILTELVAVMDKNPSINLIHPMLVGLKGYRQYSVRKLPTPADLLMRRFIPDTWFRRQRKDYLLCDLDTSRAWHLPYVQGSFMLLRCSKFEEAGLFDERFFMYPEDIDLSRRLFPHGGIVYYPFVKAMHVHRHQSYSSGRLLRVHIRNMIKYFNKWGWFFDSERRVINRSIDEEVRAFRKTPGFRPATYHHW